MTSVHMFVYGTLRVGEYNDRRFGLSDQAGDIVRDVEVAGAMYNLRGDRPVYPVVDFDAEGTVVGDLLINLPLSGIVSDVVAMERGAGYEMRFIEVAGLDVAVFHMPDAAAHGGQHIETGDWIGWASSADPQ